MQEPAEQQRGRMRVAEGAVGVGVADAEFTAAVVQAAQSQNRLLSRSVQIDVVRSTGVV